jgi:pimeloyl-ACP methyl ester carboxylesterase
MTLLPLAVCLLFGAAALAGTDPLVEDPVPDLSHPPAIMELNIPSAGLRLPGLIYLANGAGPHPTVVLLHGIPGNEKNLDIAQALRRAGFNVLFFHYRGAWGAEGSYSVLQVAEDALAALAMLRNPLHAKRYRVDVARLSLLGHSLGGFAALRAGSDDDGLRCVGAISPLNFGPLVAGLTAEDTGAEAFLAYADTLYMLRDFDGARLRQQLRSAAPEDIDTTLFGPGLRGKTVLLVTGESDRVTVPAINFHPVVAAYSKEPQIRMRSQVISGDHSFSWSRIALTRLLLEWYLADCR